MRMNKMLADFFINIGTIMFDNQSVLIQVIAAVLISSISGVLGVYLQKIWSSRKPKINIQSIGFHGDTIKIAESTTNMSKEIRWGGNIEGYVDFDGIIDYEAEMAKYSAELERARKEADEWLQKNIELKNSLILTRTALEMCPYLHNAVFNSFFHGLLRRRTNILLPTELSVIEKLEDIYTIARETDKEIVIHHGWHATRFPIDEDFRDNEKKINKIIAYSFLKGESKNVFYLMESFVSMISGDILKIKSLQDSLRQIITDNSKVKFNVAISNVGNVPHLFNPRAFVELSYGDNKKQYLVHHQVGSQGSRSDLEQLLDKGSKKKSSKNVKVETFLDKTDMSPHILSGGKNTISASFVAHEELGSSAEEIINYYRIGGLKARLVMWYGEDSVVVSNLTTFSKSVSGDREQNLKSSANKALQRTSR